jgi:nucleotide-binding universal stress UspA family protein
MQEAEAYLRLVTNRLHRDSPDTAIQTHVQVGELIEQVRTSESGANISLIVMATHGRSRLAEALRGSTFHDRLQATTCPLVVVHSRGASRDS